MTLPALPTAFGAERLAASQPGSAPQAASVSPTRRRLQRLALNAGGKGLAAGLGRRYRVENQPSPQA